MAVTNGNKDNFAELTREGAVLVDFNAVWCGPCQMMKPVVEELVERMPEVTFVAVDVDDEEELAERYGVATIPCFVMMRDGEEVAREVGVISPKKLEKLVRSGE